MFNSIPLRCFGSVVLLGASLIARGQETQTGQSVGGVNSSSPTQGSSNQATLPAFRQEQQKLAQERQSLVNQGATPQQLAEWRQQNASRFAAQQQRAQTMSATSYLQLRPTNRQPRIPANASPTLKDFMTSQVALANAQAELHNQLVAQLTASGQGLTPAQVSQLEQQEMTTFRQQHAADLQHQRQLGQALANELARHPMPIPQARIPAGTTPQMVAYLTARNQLMASRAQVWNQNLNADPTTRQTAMEQWRQQNATAIQQLQQMAQSQPTDN
jgi:hypothetical protein